jgi:hypothetical protein
MIIFLSVMKISIMDISILDLRRNLIFVTDVNLEQATF